VFETALVIWMPPISALGSMSGAVEAVAATIAAGVLLGGFVAGTWQRLAYSRPLGRRDDNSTVDAGYAGGWLAALALLSDLLLG
jgi:hypothetical protein